MPSEVEFHSNEKYTRRKNILAGNNGIHILEASTFGSRAIKLYVYAAGDKQETQVARFILLHEALPILSHRCPSIPLMTCNAWLTLKRPSPPG
jgi:hypothetical protein